MGVNRNSLLFLLVIVLVCIVGGIGGYLGAARVSSSNQAAQPIARPTLSDEQLQATSVYGTQIAATIQAVEGGVILRNAWVFSSSEEDGDDDTIANTEQGLVITAKRPGTKFRTTIASNLPWDVDASVTAQQLPSNPCDSWAYSLTIRQQIDSGSFKKLPYYDFRVASNRKWRFGWDDAHSSLRILASGVIQQDFDIKQPNILRVVAKGQHFDLYINDEMVGSADDSFATTAPNNGIGVSVDTCSGTASALFTNMIVKTPS